MEIVSYGDVKFLKSEKLDGVLHGFSLRFGGVSKGEFDSLNVGLRRGDNPFKSIRNIEICTDALNMEKKNLTLTYQLHTNNVEFVTGDDIGKGFIREWGKGVDGIVTDAVNVPLMCYSADCVPILFYEPQRGLIGAVHSGWRGTKDNIAKAAVSLMKEKGGNKEKIRAFIGPAIGMCCYEVSKAVADEFSDYLDCIEAKSEEKFMLDLKSIVKTQLLNIGVREENIDLCPMCTACENDLFFSHRKQQGKSGLLGGFIQMI